VGESQSNVSSGFVEELGLLHLVTINANNCVAIYWLAAQPFPLSEEVVEALKHQLAVEANHVVPGVFRACREVPNEVELSILSSDFGNGPEEITFWIHEGKGPEDMIWRFAAILR